MGFDNYYLFMYYIYNKSIKSQSVDVLSPQKHCFFEPFILIVNVRFWPKADIQIPKYTRMEIPEQTLLLNFIVEI